MYIINQNSEVATMRLYGTIGFEVDCNEFARELASLDGRCKRVELRINSGGGSVCEGYSIISAMMSMSTPVYAYIDGLAASMAGVVAVAADRVYMMDYAQFMMHDPSFTDADGEDLSDKAKNILSLTKSSIQKLLSRRGCDETIIGNLMADETWLSAEQTKELGLCDEIITSAKKGLKNLHPALLAARVSAEFKTTINQNKTMEFKLIAAYLGVAAGIDEAGIVAALKERDSALEKREKAILDHYIAIGRKNGIVTDDNKERYERFAKADFELFVDQVTVEKQIARLSEVVNKLGGAGTEKETKGWDWYQKNDPRALSAMEYQDPAKFKRLLDDYEKSLNK